VARAGFDSPTAALAAVRESLAPLASRIHVGSLGSGMTLNCCDGGKVLRIESNGARASDGPQTMRAGTCKTVGMDISVTLMSCFMSSTKDGKERAIGDLTADGTTIMLSWWSAFNLLACAEPPNTSRAFNTLLRFVAINEAPPEGGCANWTMTLETDIHVCACHAAWAQ
jgi:hypothetical protein